MADHSICLTPGCGAWADGAVAACPRCGGPMKAEKGPTARGWVLLVLGLFLALLMGAITWMVAPYMLQAGKEVDGTSFSGTMEQAQMVLALFAGIIVLGLMFAINGIYIIATGRQSKLFTILSLGMAGLVFLVAFLLPRALE
ncbi:MAG: hypothetical protein ACXWUX_16585 [Allosphingosinicella sp.]